MYYIFSVYTNSSIKIAPQAVQYQVTIIGFSCLVGFCSVIYCISGAVPPFHITNVKTVIELVIKISKFVYYPKELQC